MKLKLKIIIFIIINNMHLEQAEIEGANVIIIIIMFERN